MTRILLTNDDGVMSPGLWALRDALTEIGEIMVVAPDRPRSASGMSLTLHKPLRITRITVEGSEAYAVSGNPADCVALGINQIMKDHRPDAVVAGINPTDNTSVQVVLTSGTVAAAIHAAVDGIPAIAFSAAPHLDQEPTREDIESRLSRGLIVGRRILDYVAKTGLPNGVDFLNVNFPSVIKKTTEVKITRLARKRYEDAIVERLDPRDTPYYWQTGRFLNPDESEPGTDVHAVHVEGAISVSPLSLDLSRLIDATAMKDILAQIQG